MVKNLVSCTLVTNTQLVSSLSQILYMLSLWFFPKTYRMYDVALNFP